MAYGTLLVSTPPEKASETIQEIKILRKKVKEIVNVKPIETDERLNEELGIQNPKANIMVEVKLDDWNEKALASISGMLLALFTSDIGIETIGPYKYVKK